MLPAGRINSVSATSRRLTGIGAKEGVIINAESLKLELVFQQRYHQSDCLGVMNSTRLRK